MEAHTVRICGSYPNGCFDKFEVQLTIRRLSMECGAGQITSGYMSNEIRIEVESEEEVQVLVILNRLDEILVVKTEEEIKHVAALTTRSRTRFRVGSSKRRTKELDAGLKKHLVGNIRELTQDEAKMFTSMMMDNDVDLFELIPISSEPAAGRDKLIRLYLKLFDTLSYTTTIQAFKVAIKESVNV
ncbi:LOW QUALITY PROTEIN: hypothetical protein PHMEG_0007272 [Phytophthora megakarya]|uniref:Uncharacterized protein n=1 Tax=Phytophthora megakarya TaxID=4795 RepID=A0A225WNR3_9STRA|nr:LOW QUALITY PROTEIN: hypothetical protein PHMEG_0007272 [Phytophthora megakarya]